MVSLSGRVTRGIALALAGWLAAGCSIGPRALENLRLRYNTSLDKNCICEAHLQCVIRFSGQYFSSENHFLKPIGGEMRDSFSFDRLDTSYAAQTSGLWLFQQTFLVLGAVVL